MDKKELIVHAAIEAFQEKGIDKTTVSDIVKRAGIAQGTFYLYFSSKLAVMPAIAEVMVEKMITEVKEAVNSDASFSIQLREMIEAIFSVTRRYQEIIALIYVGLASTNHLKQWEAIYDPFYQWMSAFLQEAKHAGIIRSSIHCERTAKLIIGFVETAAEQMFLYDSVHGDAIEIQQQEVFDFLTHALNVK